MTEWKDPKDIIKNDRPILVQLKEELLGSLLHVAVYSKNITTISGNFDFDCPEVVCWTNLPKPKEFK